MRIVNKRFNEPVFEQTIKEDEMLERLFSQVAKAMPTKSFNKE
ncbi:hypothetical protein OKW96_15950 [Sphingobacterium sp. KU25419]|nr:hypothetical protein OKW96_15950 [Sphingobacterium sp. KU25419]